MRPPFSRCPLLFSCILRVLSQCARLTWRRRHWTSDALESGELPETLLDPSATLAPSLVLLREHLSVLQASLSPPVFAKFWRVCPSSLFLSPLSIPVFISVSLIQCWQVIAREVGQHVFSSLLSDGHTFSRSGALQVRHSPSSALLLLLLLLLLCLHCTFLLSFASAAARRADAGAGVLALYPPPGGVL